MTKSPRCLLCGAAFEPFMSFGRQPIANAFLTPEKFSAEHFYELTVGHCGSCGMVQLGELVDPSFLFHDEYAFFSGTSKGMARHFALLAGELRERYLGSADPFVIEIGSNDGVMLRNLQDLRHLGVEPSANVAAAARAQGISTLVRFFNEELAREIRSEHGPADVIAAANVMCHIPDLATVIRGVDHLLTPSGVLVFEDPYLGDIVEKTAFDQIYDEHVFYFSVSSLSRAFARHGMEIVDAEPQPVHGGSMRYTVARRGSRRPSSRVMEQQERERDIGLDRDETYVRLRGRVERTRDRLVSMLHDLRAQGKRVVGYGATSKSTTVTNYCGITSELIEFISDTTPIKQGKYSPGTHIPVRPHDEFVARPPERALLFAWNHAEEILAKEQAFIAEGGRFIVYVPEVGTIP